MKGKRKDSNQWSSDSPATQEGLSQQDQEYVQAHEDEIKWQTQKIKSAKIDGYLAKLVQESHHLLYRRLDHC